MTLECSLWSARAVVPNARSVEAIASQYRPMALAVFGVLAPGDVPAHGSPRHAGATGQGLQHVDTFGSARSGGSRSLSRQSLRILEPPVLDFVPRGPADGLVRSWYRSPRRVSFEHRGVESCRWDPAQSSGDFLRHQCEARSRTPHSCSVGNQGMR